MELEGLNILLHLNHRHKAVIVGLQPHLSVRHCWSPAHKGSREHHPPVNSMWEQGGTMKKKTMKRGAFSFLFPMEGAEGQRGSEPWPMSCGISGFLLIIKKPELPDNTGWEKTLSPSLYPAPTRAVPKQPPISVSVVKTWLLRIFCHFG